MALGRWKQRAISLDSLESTDTLLPEDDEVQIVKKPRLQIGTQKVAGPRSFMGVLDDEEHQRPSSGDSGISSDHHHPLNQRSSAATNSELSSDVPTVVDLSKATGKASKSVPLKVAAISGKTTKSLATADNKENSPGLTRCQKPQKGRQRKTTKTATQPAKTDATAAVEADAGNLTAAGGASSERPPAGEPEGPGRTDETQENPADSLRLRRIEANARERTRVHTIGAAFDALRQSVPSNSDQQKLSKLAVLRIAAAYIRSLAALADGNSEEFSGGVNQVTQALFIDGARTKTLRGA